MPKTSKQYRIRGTMTFVGGDADAHDAELLSARKQLWGNMSDSAREGFLSQPLPGKPYEQDTSDVTAGGRDEDGKVISPPDNFLLLLVKPTEVNYLCLTGDQYMQEDKLGADSQWSAQRLNP